MNLEELRDRINKGIIYCDKLYSKKEKCVRLINRYDCETCDENKLLFCRCWRKIIDLTKEYYITQIVYILNEYIKKQEQIPKREKHMEQQNLFKLR